MDKRAFSITTPEISTIFFAIGFLLMIFGIKEVLKMNEWALMNNMQGLSGSLMIVVMVMVLMFIFYLLSVAFPVYQIIKNNLFIFIDRISNPDYIGWFGFNRNKKFYPQVVKIGSFGKTMGIMAGVSADVINDGTYTGITTNGNQTLIVSDMLSNNINLDNAVGWNLIKKHHGVVGYQAYERAVAMNQTVFEIEKPTDKLPQKEE